MYLMVHFQLKLYHPFSLIKNELVNGMGGPRMGSCGSTDTTVTQNFIFVGKFGYNFKTGVLGNRPNANSDCPD